MGKDKEKKSKEQMEDSLQIRMQRIKVRENRSKFRRCKRSVGKTQVNKKKDMHKEKIEGQPRRIASTGYEKTKRRN
jgi:hypothetical protein